MWGFSDARVVLRRRDAAGGRDAAGRDHGHERVDAVLARFDDPRLHGEATAAVDATVVHGVLQREFGFGGSYQSVRRYTTFILSTGSRRRHTLTTG